MEGARRPHYQVTFAILAVGIGAYALLQSLGIPVLTTVAKELHTSQDAVTWVLTAYLLGLLSQTERKTTGQPTPEIAQDVRNHRRRGRSHGVAHSMRKSYASRHNRKRPITIVVSFRRAAEGSTGIEGRLAGHD